MRRLSFIIYQLSFSVALLAVLLLAACADNETVSNEEPLPDGYGRIRITVCTPENSQSQKTRGVYEDDSDNAVHEYPWETPNHDWEVMHSLRVFICKALNNEVVQILTATDSEINHASSSTATPGQVGGNDYKYGTSVTLESEPLPAGNYHIFATANFNDNYSVGDVIDMNGTVQFLNGLSTVGNNDYTAQDYADVDNFIEVLPSIPYGEFKYIDKSGLTDDEKEGFEDKLEKYGVVKYLGTNTDKDNWQKNIPLTGYLLKMKNSENQDVDITVQNAKETDAGTLYVWRTMSKLEFEFTNEASQTIRIKGIEVEPINQASASGATKGIYLFSHDDLTSTADLAAGTGITLPTDAREDVGKVKYEPSTPLKLAANETGNIFFYVNETDATYTVTQNQLSLRFKIQRLKEGKTGDNETDWYDEEIRYGVTTPYVEGSEDQNGFNVIRRNDWIHIPVHLTDWQLRIEPLAFVPIAGYPATLLSSNGLTATFSTGGMIALQPFVKKKDDSTWRDFGDTRITYGNVVKDQTDNTKDDVNASWVASITWKNEDDTGGEDSQYGSGKIITTPFRYDPATKSIIGELNNNLPNTYAAGGHMTTFTIVLTLEQYTYSFTFNVILQK